MNDMDRLPADAAELLDKLCEGDLAPNEAAELERLVCEYPAVCRLYLRYVDIHVELRRRYGRTAEHAADVGRDVGFGDFEIWRFGDIGLGDSGSRVGDSEFGDRDSGFGIGDMQIPNPKSQIPNQHIPSLSPLPPSLSPLPSPLSTPFVGGPVFSYIAATLILGVMLLGAWAYKISHDYSPSLATNSRRLTAAGESAPQRPELVFVARVTGMKDCRWADPQTETFAGAYVPLGRKYALSSGLMEITYSSGAKVILEGPCLYKVESAAGGFLALGKLTARIGERGEGRGEGGKRPVVSGQWPVAGTGKASGTRLPTNPQIPKSLNPQIANYPPLSTLHSPLFTVRTPTAVVTDLGTEFGVEVAANGDTASHVFQGSINVRVAEGMFASSPEGPAASAAGDAGQITLVAGESARVEKAVQTGAARITAGRQAGAAPKFVRRIHDPLKYLDLLDIVAGGDGTGRRRERGIDPVTGGCDPAFVPGTRFGNNHYCRIKWHKLIDGVFIPEGSGGPVQIDSAGHLFDGFDRTAGLTWGSIWPRAAEVKPPAESDAASYWISGMGRGEEFMPQGRGLLALHASAGITFDLEAVRNAHVGVRPERFRATVGMADASKVSATPVSIRGQADVWVLVDGRLKFSRPGLAPADGVLSIDVPLAPGDRFLTLVTTDGNSGHAGDWVVFGDPALLINSTEPRNQKQ